MPPQRCLLDIESFAANREDSTLTYMGEPSTLSTVLPDQSRCSV
jgi:hypothetical protein